MIGHVLFAYKCRNQSDRNYVKATQCYVSKSNLETRKENVNLHIEIVNVANIVGVNDPKTSSFKGDVVAPNNGSDK